MATRLCGTVGVLLLLSVGLVGADFWHDKDFTDWSTRDVEKMLTDSPWADTVSIHTSDLSLRRRVGGLSGGIVGTGGGVFRGGVNYGGGGVSGEGAGNIGGGSFMAPPQRTRLLVRWVSALPVRQALARYLAATGQDMAATLEQTTAEEEAVYRVAVVGIPIDLPESPAGVRELLAATGLKRRDAAPIHPDDIRISYENGLLSFEFQFPRAPITLDEREVEFFTTLGHVRISKIFTLADMVMSGRLAL